MRVSRLLSLSALAILAVSFGPAIHAATITAGTTTQVANGGTAPGSALDYVFFGGSQPRNLTDFSVSTGSNAQFGGTGSYTTVIAPGGDAAFLTGIAYDSSCHCDQTSVIATFSSATISSFAVYILDANTDGSRVGNASVGLGVNGGAAMSMSTIYSGDNEFTEFLITGATAEDTFQVYATGGGEGDYPSLGGLTFGPNEGPSPVPEPASLALLGTGLLCGLGIVRRKFKA